MKITIEAHRAATVISLSGEFSLDDSDTFRRQARELLENRASDIILDCSEVDLIDSIGLESLLWLSDETESCGFRLRVARASRSLRRVLTLTRLERALRVHESVEAAAMNLTQAR